MNPVGSITDFIDNNRDNFAQKGWRVDAVEIDPVVIEVAQEHFGLTESEGRIRARRGRIAVVENEHDAIDRPAEPDVGAAGSVDELGASGLRWRESRRGRGT